MGSLEELALTDDSQGDATAYDIIDVVHRVPSLKRLYLSDYRTTETIMSRLLQVLPQCAALQSLSLPNSSMVDSWSADLVRLIPECMSLTKLDISGNHADQKTIAAVIDVLPRVPALRILDLQKHTFGAEQTRRLIPVLRGTLPGQQVLIPTAHLHNNNLKWEVRSLMKWNESLPWSDDRHASFPKWFRSHVRTLMLAAGRASCPLCELPDEMLILVVTALSAAVKSVLTDCALTTRETINTRGTKRVERAAAADGRARRLRAAGAK